MILFHGTNVTFREIDLRKSRPNKDFGRGFYLTADKSQAGVMARQKCLQEDGKPNIIPFLFDENCLVDGSLRCLRFDSYSEEWVRFILLNRTNRSHAPAHDFDVVVGPIADDRVGVQLFRYSQHFIDIKTLIENLKFKRLTIQYFFGTPLAISKLKPL